MTIAAIILAAGRSTRMGTNKLLLELDGKPLLHYAVEAAFSANINPVLVVTGHQRSEVEAALAGFAVEFVHNADFASGMAGSLKLGIAALPKEAGGAVILLGDMPRISSSVIEALVLAFAAHPDKAALVPVIEGEWGNPVLLGRELFSELQGLSGDRGARKLLEAYHDRVLLVPQSDLAIFLDVDTPEALNKC